MKKPVKAAAAWALIALLCVAPTAIASDENHEFTGIGAALGLYPEGMTWDDIVALEGEPDVTADIPAPGDSDDSLTQMLYSDRTQMNYPCAYGFTISANSGVLAEVFYAFDPYSPSEGDGGQYAALLDMLRTRCGEPTQATATETMWELPGGLVTLKIHLGGEDAVGMEYLLLTCETAPLED